MVTAGDRSVYEGVICKKRQGILVLSAEHLEYKATDDAGDAMEFKINWGDIENYILNKATSAKAMMKMTVKEGEGTGTRVFQLPDRDELELLRAEIHERKQEYESPSPLPKNSSEKGKGGDDDKDVFEENPDCMCRSQDPEYRGPTTLEVQDSMNRALSLNSLLGNEAPLVLERAIPTAGGNAVVVSLLEVEAFGDDSCIEENRRYRTAVLVEMDAIGRLFKSEDDDETLLFTNTFQYIFNELNFLACDAPSFRRVDSVEIMTYTLPNDLVLLNVSGTCQTSSCQIDAPLFTKDSPDYPTLLTRRTTVQESEVTTVAEKNSNKPLHYFQEKTGTRRRGEEIEGASNTCVYQYCPINVPNLMRSPTEEEFQEAYQENLEQFNVLVPSTGASNNNDTSTTTTTTSPMASTRLKDILEVQVFECTSNFVHYPAHVWIEMEGSVELMTEDEISTLENAIVQTYNEMNTLYCDVPVFRRALNATVLLPFKKPLQSTPSKLENFQRL